MTGPVSAPEGGSLSWQELAAASLARQFPDPPAGRGPQDVARTLARIGPIQAQTARSPFLGLAARLPGVTRVAVAAAYEEHLVVRGSTLRGTVHTSTPPDHRLTEVATRLGRRTLWARTLRPAAVDLERLWADIEIFAREDWRAVDELVDHVNARLAERHAGVAPMLTNTLGRSLSFGHGGLLRRPLVGGWEGQGRPGYRAARAVLGDDVERDAALADPAGSLARLVRRHLTCHGPASRHDLAWWSGCGLRAVDAALASLPGLVTATSPDGRVVHDLPGLPSAPAPGSHAAAVLGGVRLLPEFDALLCGYDPVARDRFIDPAHHRALWNDGNGLLLPPLLVDGRITGHWRPEGNGVKRRCVVTWFARTRRPRKAEVEEQLAHVGAAMGWTWTGLEITRADPR